MIKEYTFNEFYNYQWNTTSNVRCIINEIERESKNQRESENQSHNMDHEQHDYLSSIYKYSTASHNRKRAYNCQKKGHCECSTVTLFRFTFEWYVQLEKYRERYDNPLKYI